MSQVVWHAELVESEQLWFRIGSRGDEVVAEWPGLCLLVAQRDGSSPRLTFEAGVDARTAEKIRRGSAALLLRHLEGKLGLHGAAVAMNGRAVILLGRSGAGKSTLAAALCAGGAVLLSDDAIAIDPGPSDGWLVSPQEVDHWLDRGAQEAVGLGAADAAVAAGGLGRRNKDPVRSSRSADGPVRLVALVELAFGGAGPTLTRQHGIDAARSLVPQVARFILDDPELQRRELDLIHRIVVAVPCLRLERPRDFGHLRGTVARLLALLGEDPPLELS